ncbi:UPF0481 protein At3g47200-like [Tasmannia lanceolata]|uniref:UPF0481 protein At3g47200-like n=1 Tax=Tasmannia lanceolata TaxID=3420 RepID=UPI0040640105
MVVPEKRTLCMKKLSPLRCVRAVAAMGSIRGRRKPMSPKPSEEIEREKENHREEEKEEHQGRSPTDTKTTRDRVSEIEEEWVIKIEEKLDHVNQGPCWQNHCIFRVPENLRKIDPDAYAPQILTIGPYHRDVSRFAEMENHKWRFLRNLIERKNHSVKIYLKAMSVLEVEARQCYAGPIQDMDSREFVEMMVLDASFIVELLRRSMQRSWEDPIFTALQVLSCLKRDMLMLENQLPFFVLVRLFELTTPESERTSSITQIALHFFNSAIAGCYNTQITRNYDEQGGLHLLHVIRQSLLPSLAYCPGKIDQTQLMVHCVLSLRSCGIKFQKRESDKFMDIEFRKGVLHIPPLVIHDSTKSIFLNLMAFEQCYPYCTNHVTSYISFMDGLINCPKDVGYLRQLGIINHWLGSEEDVARLFNGLCREIALDVDNCYLSDVSAEVNLLFDRRWHAWRASLMHEYLRHPWAVVSLLGATVLIVVSITQTFYSVFAYYIPHS